MPNTRKNKVDPISPENYDPWVYNVTKENIWPFPQTHGVDTTFLKKGLAQKRDDEKTPTASADPEKLHILQPEFYQNEANHNGVLNPHGPRTTFYNSKPVPKRLSQERDDGETEVAAVDPEKVHILQPEYYQNEANNNGVLNPNGPRTTFYNGKQVPKNKI